MFMAFEGAPKILRLFGTGYIHRVGSPEYNSLYSTHYKDTVPDLETVQGKRSIIVISVDEVAFSCGFGVPYYEYKGNRPTLLNYWGKKTEENVVEYWCKENAQSVDGLPGMKYERMNEVASDYRKTPPVMAGRTSLVKAKEEGRVEWMMGFGQQLLMLWVVAVAAFGAGLAVSSHQLQA
jgi:hypothetical protein